MPLKIKSALICDDVREEKTGKQILIGVYTGDIIFPSSPAHFSPTFWVELVPFVQNDDMSIEVKLEAPGNNDVRAGADTHIEEQVSILLVFRLPQPLKIAETGDLKLSMRPKGGRKWTNVITKMVRFAESSAPSPQ